MQPYKPHFKQLVWMHSERKNEWKNYFSDRKLYENKNGEKCGLIRFNNAMHSIHLKVFIEREKEECIVRVGLTNEWINEWMNAKTSQTGIFLSSMLITYFMIKPSRD